MYAVIETGGKQYRVEVGTELEVELLDVEPGKTITLERVLLIADGAESSIGRPLVPGAQVQAEVVRQTRGEKLISFKYRPKARSRVKKGHRQELTVLRINDIMLGGKSAAKSARKAQDEARTERKRLEEAAVAQAARDAELAARLAVGAEAAAEPAGGTKAAPATARPAKAAAKAAKAAPVKAAAARLTPSGTAGAGTEAGAPAETGPTTPAPKRARTKAPAVDTEATGTSPKTPKRTRAAKKDE